MLGLLVIILFKSLLHVFCSLVFSAHNSSGEPVGGIGGKAKEIHQENRGREHMERARRLLRKGKGKAARRTGDFLCKFLTTYFPTNTINITVVVNITVKVSGVCAI